MALASVRPTPVGTMAHAETMWSPRIAQRADGRRFTWSAGASSCEREAKAAVRRRQRRRFEKRQRDRGRNRGRVELGRQGRGGRGGGARRGLRDAGTRRGGRGCGGLAPVLGGERSRSRAARGGSYLRLRWRRLVRFFFHFQRIFECAFFHGLDLWPPPRRRSTRWSVDSFWML